MAGKTERNPKGAGTNPALYSWCVAYVARGLRRRHPGLGARKACEAGMRLMNRSLEQTFGETPGEEWREARKLLRPLPPDVGIAAVMKTLQRLEAGKPSQFPAADLQAYQPYLDDAIDGAEKYLTLK